jgi:hypothetical protein
VSGSGLDNQTEDFDLRALYEALDEQRVLRRLTWSAVAEQVSRRRTKLRPVAQSTITSLKDQRVGESPIQTLPGFDCRSWRLVRFFVGIRAPSLRRSMPSGATGD